MAYFSNGTEGLSYQEAYCFRCRNWRDKGDGRGEGCAIWDAHLLYAYELCNEDGHPGKIILDMLIPQKDLYAGECELFSPDPQLSLLAVEG